MLVYGGQVDTWWNYYDAAKIICDVVLVVGEYPGVLTGDVFLIGYDLALVVGRVFGQGMIRFALQPFAQTLWIVINPFLSSEIVSNIFSFVILKEWCGELQNVLL